MYNGFYIEQIRMEYFVFPPPTTPLFIHKTFAASLLWLLTWQYIFIFGKSLLSTDCFSLNKNRWHYFNKK